MKLSFRSKMLLAITGITVCASLTISLIYLGRTREDIESSYIQSLWKTMSVSLASFDENARAAYDTAVSLQHDQALMALLAAYDGADTDGALRLASYLDSFPLENRKHIYIYLPALRQTLTSTESHAVQRDSALGRPWLADGTSSLSPQLVHDDIALQPGYLLVYPVRMSGEADAPVISVNLDERRVFYQYLDGIDTGSGDSYYMLDSAGYVASASSLADLGRPFTEVTGLRLPLSSAGHEAEAFVDGPDLLVAAVRSPMTGYRLVAVSDRRALTATLHRQTRYLIGFLVLVMLLMLIPAYQMSNKVYFPVKKLLGAMQRVSEGDLSARASITSNDEIATLGEGFNEMVERIEGLIDDLVSEQMQKKEAELEALQYQITPHFMYNTLNSIKYAAILQGNEQVGEQLAAFIELLQASISRGGAFITVRDETRMVQNYVKLQQFRYQDSFSVTYDLSAEAARFYVPRLILQPLVENAILHGQDAGGLCRITVSTAVANGTIVLSVQDAGIGMTQEQMRRLQQGKALHRSGFSGIGVPNIIERLRLYYGDEASLQFTSSEHGTKATILLPAATGADDYTI